MWRRGMSGEHAFLDVRALREDFDASFTVPATVTRRDAAAFLAVRIGTEPFAIRLLDIAGLTGPRTIVRVPSRRAELLGIVGMRGAVVPVYSLARMLGRTGVADDAPWLILAGTVTRLALAVTRFEGHRYASNDDIDTTTAPRDQRHIAEIVRVGSELRPVIAVASIVRAIAEA